MVVPNTPYSMCVQDSWEILEGVRGEGFSQGQEQQRQESCGRHRAGLRYGVLQERDRLFPYQTWSRGREAETLQSVEQ